MEQAMISGLVLAGGRGSRMGNVDKGLQPFRSSTMVEHVLARLRRHAHGRTVLLGVNYKF